MHAEWCPPFRRQENLTRSGNKASTLTYDDVYGNVVHGPHMALASLRRDAGTNFVT